MRDPRWGSPTACATLSPARGEEGDADNLKLRSYHFNCHHSDAGVFAAHWRNDMLKAEQGGWGLAGCVPSSAPVCMEFMSECMSGIFCLIKRRGIDSERWLHIRCSGGSGARTCVKGGVPRGYPAAAA